MHEDFRARAPRLAADTVRQAMAYSYFHPALDVYAGRLPGYPVALYPISDISQGSPATPTQKVTQNR